MPPNLLASRDSVSSLVRLFFWLAAAGVLSLPPGFLKVWPWHSPLAPLPRRYSLLRFKDIPPSPLTATLAPVSSFLFFNRWPYYLFFFSSFSNLERAGLLLSSAFVRSFALAHTSTTTTPNLPSFTIFFGLEP